MSKLERQRIVDQDIVGLKHFDQLGSLLEQLQDVGCGGVNAITLAIAHCTWICIACNG